MKQTRLMRIFFAQSFSMTRYQEELAHLPHLQGKASLISLLDLAIPHLILYPEAKEVQT
jgi:hypothetical protein